MLKIVIKVNSYFFCSVVHLDNLNLRDLTGENFTRPVKFTATFRTDKNVLYHRIREFIWGMQMTSD